MEANIGIFLGTVAALIVWILPIAFVRRFKLKIGEPRDIFVEPVMWKLMIYSIVGSVVTAACALIVGGLLHSTHIEVLVDTEGVVGAMLTMFAILSVVVAPTTIYMLNALLRYKRIVQYGSAEWKRIRK
jgi:ABC-type Fe3+ transport system permease subunit